jgi:hypothetical protein
MSLGAIVAEDQDASQDARSHRRLGSRLADPAFPSEMIRLPSAHKPQSGSRSSCDCGCASARKLAECAQYFQSNL